MNQIGATRISDFSSIAYDGVGNRNSVTASIPSATGLDGTTTYTYDSKDQLDQETSTRNGGLNDGFSYDSSGNPSSFKGATKSYNSNNQETGTGFGYDGNGNPTTYGGTTLTFDPENRMIGYGSALSAAYTGDGLRAWKENSSGRTYFLYDVIVPVVELNSSASVVATNTFGANGLISRQSGSTSVFYSCDSEGNVAQRSSAIGSILSHHLYSAHGSVLSGALNEPFGYKAQFGYYTDNETGLQLLTHRYYDPSRGRFLTRDPIGYGGRINLYAYVGNSPTVLVDPLGHDGDNPYLPDPNRKPAGWTPSWPTGRDGRGPYSEDPSGRRWYPHPEDDGHWDHYDFGPGKRYPQDSRKPWPGQKRPPYGDQSPNGPWPQFAPKFQGPGMDELRMHIEANQQMERFWGKILGGSVIGGACVIGGPVIGLPAALRWMGWMGGAAAATAH